MEEKMLHFQTILASDPEYQVLLQRYCHAQAAFRMCISRLDTEDRDVIMEYLGALAEMQVREMELALYDRSL